MAQHDDDEKDKDLPEAVAEEVLDETEEDEDEPVTGVSDPLLDDEKAWE